MDIDEATFKTILSKNLRYYLDLCHMTQIELASKLNVGTTSVYNWCNGIKTPRMDKIDKMCQIFGCNRSDLITEKHAEDPKTKGFVELFLNAPKEYQDAAVLLLKSAPPNP